MRRLPFPPSLAAAGLMVALAAALATPRGLSAHSPSVVDGGNETPDDAVVLDDPTLSRAIGSKLAQPGESDWYRMDLRRGDPLVVEITAPDAAGGIPTSFAVLGPGLPQPVSDEDSTLAAMVGADGVIRHEPAGGGREVHGGLGFIAWGGISTEAPADGTYWIAVRAAVDGATGKYVLAPGLREEFGLDAIGGMAGLISLFNEPWPPDASRGGIDGAMVALVVIVVALVMAGGALGFMRLRHSRRGSPAPDGDGGIDTPGAKPESAP